MEGCARAPAAGTVLNALATGTGAAFAIDLTTTATVTLSDDGGVTGRFLGHPDADTTLIERCVQRVIDRCGPEEVTGGHVETESDVPMAAGLKSSSAAANATVLATLGAVDRAAAIDREDATRIGVAAARDAGVTVTGAFDDASASMLGGLTITDNTSDRVLARDQLEADVAIFTPDERAYTAEADADACARIAGVADVVADLAIEGRYETAMTVNGFAYCAALGFSTGPMIDALDAVAGVSLSGTGPSTVAIGGRDDIETVAEHWESRAGTVRTTQTDTEGGVLL